MKRVGLIAAAMTPLLLALPSAALAQWAANIPGGSWRYTCAPSATYMSGTTLYSKCSPKHGDLVDTHLDTHYCISGSITNENGQLTCTLDAVKMAKDQAAAAQQKASSDAYKAKFNSAFPAFRSASVIVLGDDASQSDAQTWLAEIAKPDYGMTADIADGIDFSEAVRFLKAYIAHPEGAAARARAISNAYLEVYARPATAVEQAGRDAEVRAGKSWYATIVTAEIARESKDDSLRTALLNQAYNQAMGRNARPADLSYWMRRSEHARQIIEATRAFLYSSNGAADLAETVGRSLVAKGKEASEANIKALMITCTADRAIYSEMISSKYDYARSKLK